MAMAAAAGAVPQPASPPVDPRLGTLAGAAAAANCIDLSADDLKNLPLAEINTDGDLQNIDGADAYDRFLASEAKDAPAGGLTIANVPSALVSPTVSASSSDGEL